jgi:hypothetical protein
MVVDDITSKPFQIPSLCLPAPLAVPSSLAGWLAPLVSARVPAFGPFVERVSRWSR